MKSEFFSMFGRSIPRFCLTSSRIRASSALPISASTTIPMFVGHDTRSSSQTVAAGKGPAATVWLEDLVSWPTNIGIVVEAEIGSAELARIRDEVRQKRGIDLPNMEKNSLFIGYVMAQAWEEGRKSPTLERLCNH